MRERSTVSSMLHYFTFVLGLSLALGMPVIRGLWADAQSHGSGIDVLARSLGVELNRSGIKRVVVFDFRPAEGKWLAFGSWLADQFSATLAQDGQGIEVVDRMRLAAAMEGRQLSFRDNLGAVTESQIAVSLGADTIVSGSFGAFGNQVGVTLVASRVSDIKLGGLSKLSCVVNGKVPLDKQVSEHLEVPLNSLQPSDGINRAGTAGLTIPQCESCPDPHFSPIALFKQPRGTIVVSFVVSPEGRPTEIKVVQSVSDQLDADFIKAVLDYRFAPARDPDGDPVSARMHYSFGFSPAR
jgi:TonB family protein